jgi:hypothetical protein
MKSFLTIALSFFCLIQAVIGQVDEGFFGIGELEKMIIFYVDGKYDKLDSLLKNYGFSKSRDVPKANLFSIYESYTYTNDKLCSKTDIRVQVYRNNEVSSGNTEYYIRYNFYSSFSHEKDEDQLKEFLKKYEYNPLYSASTGSSDKYDIIKTNTPESVKRNGDLYLKEVTFDIMDGKSRSATFCGLNYRIGYYMYFRRGYASLDTIGFVSTNEGSNLRMRDGPSLNSSVIISIPNKSKFLILEYSDKLDFVNGQSGNWYKIKYADQIGWAWGNFIRFKNEK